MHGTTEVKRTPRQSPFQHAAQALWDDGYHVIPVMPWSSEDKDGRGLGKAPGERIGGRWQLMKDWTRFCGVRPTQDELNEWVARGSGGNLGVCLGAPAGDGLVIFGIDFDPIYDGDLSDVMGQCPTSTLTKIGRKGATRLFRASPETLALIGGSQRFALGELGGIDVLAHGRQTLMPWSKHPAGMLYTYAEPPRDDGLYHIPAANELPVFDEDHWSKFREALELVPGFEAIVRKPKGGAGPASAFNGAEDSVWRVVNEWALNRLDMWVPALELFGVKENKGEGAFQAVAHWRQSGKGKALRDRGANLSIHPQGIKDFGTGDTYSAVDLVMRARGVKNGEALGWLEEQLGLKEEVEIVQFQRRSLGGPTGDGAEIGAGDQEDEQYLRFVAGLGQEDEEGQNEGQAEALRAARCSHGYCGFKIDDFVSCPSENKFLYRPTGHLWIAKGVDGVLTKVKRVGRDPVNASRYLSETNSVAQLTWAPGEPEFIKDMVMSEGCGFTPKRGVTIYNKYRPAVVKPADATKAERWVEHVKTVFGEEHADHIINWCAQRVQQPGIKLNHAIVLGGEPGVGKDTVVTPVRYAVGVHNFEDIEPETILTPYHGYMKSVILRISELGPKDKAGGWFDQEGFYNRTKRIIAAPPETHRVNEKHLREYYVPNVTGVVMTTNYQHRGLHLPAIDRRHFVTWSELKKGDLSKSYFDAFHHWLDHEGGYDDVAAYLNARDISGFNPKAEPPLTQAFWDMVGSSGGAAADVAADEAAAIADLIDDLGRPDTLTLYDLRREAGEQSELGMWLADKKGSATRVPSRLGACGYIKVRNSHAADELWRLLVPELGGPPGGKVKRMAIYAKTSLSPEERVALATARL
jgi:hypothetical protein